METTIKNKIVAISNELRISKEGTNAFQKYDYFTPDSIAKALNPLLEKHGLIAMFNMPYNKEKAMYEGSLKIESTENAESIEYRFDMPLTKVQGTSEAQGAGATQTYLKRYMLMNIFNIADDSSDLDSKPPVKSALEQKIENEAVAEGGRCPECGSQMVEKTGKKKDGTMWKGRQCIKVKCKHHKEFIFSPSQPTLKDLDNQAQQAEADAYDPQLPAENQ